MNYVSGRFVWGTNIRTLINQFFLKFILLHGFFISNVIFRILLWISSLYVIVAFKIWLQFHSHMFFKVAFFIFLDNFFKLRTLKIKYILIFLLNPHPAQTSEKYVIYSITFIFRNSKKSVYKVINKY